MMGSFHPTRLSSLCLAHPKTPKRPMPRLLYQELTGVIRQTAFEVHRYFGPGFLEKVYK